MGARLGLPALGLGTWKAAPGEVGAAVRSALRLGYRHIDCAAIYGNEAEIGAASELRLSAAEMEQIAGLERHHRFVGGSFWDEAATP